MYGPALIVVVGFAASAPHLAPLGIGRTDEYLYPAILLVMTGRRSPGRRRSVAASAAPRALALASPPWSPWPWSSGRSTSLHEEANAPVYPGEDVTALATALDHHMQPGDVIWVSEQMRYPWALYEDPTPHIVFGPDWSTDFTVVSTKPGVFIVPSDFFEGGYQPTVWARACAATTAFGM